MSNARIGHRAALTAVIVAFIAGLVGSLAIRPPGSVVHTVAVTEGGRTQRIHWRMPVAFQTTMPTIGDNPVYVSDTVNTVSGGAVYLEIFEPGEVVPAFNILDAVRDGKVEAGYTWLGYDQGKIPASVLLGAVPFGMEPWEFSAWWFEAGGRELGEALYEKYNAYPLFCGLTGPETAGWFRSRIDSLDDIRGLKIRFAGLGGKVIERLGASVTMLPGGEIFQALEKGAIDATEFSLPDVDQRLGFGRVAPYNYYPGWHQPATAAHMLVNLELWNGLAIADQNLLETACTAGVTRNLARSEARQGAVIAGFADIGVSAESLPLDLLRELKRIAEDVLREEAEADEDFATILAAQQRFRAEYAHWKARAYLPRDF